MLNAFIWPRRAKMQKDLPLALLRFDKDKRLSYATRPAFALWPDLHRLHPRSVFPSLVHHMVCHGKGKTSDAYAYGRTPDPESAFWDILALNPAKPDSHQMVQIFQDAEGDGMTVQLSVVHDLPFERSLQHAQKMDLLGKLAGGMAHDFNNLLSIVDGYVRLLEQKHLPEPAPDYLGRIRQAVQRGSSMTHKLLALGSIKVKADRILPLSKALQDLRPLYQPLLGSEIRLAQRIESDLFVEGPPDALTQIMMNLIINARDALKEGGSIMIDAHSSDDQIILRITDTGRGMDNVTRKRLFEPFYTTKTQGTGLGLAVVQGLVQQMNGTIAVHSELGRGSQFVLRFPKAERPDDEEDDEAERLFGSPHLQGRTILVVEDEPDLLRMLQQTLSDAGATVLAAEHGDAALLVQEDHQGKIDCLLTDVLMPGLTGPHLAELLNDLRPGMPVVYMSGYPRLLNGEQRCHVPDDALLLAKPLDPNRLVKVLAATCQQNKAASDQHRTDLWTLN